MFLQIVQGDDADQLVFRVHNRQEIIRAGQEPVRDFDVIAFSVSFEWDYTNILTMLRLAGVPLRAADRTERDPLVVIGGAIFLIRRRRLD